MSGPPRPTDTPESSTDDRGCCATVVGYRSLFGGRATGMLLSPTIACRPVQRPLMMEYSLPSWCTASVTTYNPRGVSTASTSTPAASNSSSTSELYGNSSTINTGGGGTSAVCTPCLAESDNSGHASDSGLLLSAVCLTAGTGVRGRVVNERL